MTRLVFALILCGLIYSLIAALLRPLTPEEVAAWGVAVGAPEVGKK